MSEYWADQIGVLKSTAEIFSQLVDEKEGGNETKPVYKELRATILQLRFAPDLITVIQFFLDKEKGHYAKDHTPPVCDGGVVRHFSDFADRSPRSLACSACKDDFARLSSVVRQLGFGASGGMQ